MEPMRLTLLTLTVFVMGLSSTMGQTQRSVRIGYVDMEYILANVEEYKEASDLLEKRALQWKEEIAEQQRSIAQMRADLSAEKVLLTPELIQERQDEIDALEAQMIEYQQDRFGPSGDLFRQRAQFVKPIQDQVFNAVQELAASRRYDFIFDKSADVVMLFADKRFDVSEQVLKSININRRTLERNQKQDDPVVQEPEKSEALLEKEEAYEQKKEDRAKLLEERRQEKLKEIEARKKAYEERRKKMLEEREAKKKAQETQQDSTAVKEN